MKIWLMYVGKTEGNNTLQSCEVFAELKYWATSNDANHNERQFVFLLFLSLKLKYLLL